MEEKVGVELLHKVTARIIGYIIVESILCAGT